MVRFRWSLVVISTVQLGLNLLGLRTALRDRDPANWRFLRRPPERLPEEWAYIGTARSAPGVMLLAQAISICVLAARPSRAASRALGLLGALMTFGYPVEAEFARAVRRPDPEVTPILLTGFATAVAMLVLGFRSAGRRSPHRCVSEFPRSSRRHAGRRPSADARYVTGHLERNRVRR